MTPPGGFDDLGDFAPPSSSRPWKPIAAAVAVVVVIAAGAAIALSSGSSGTSLASFVKQADAICANTRSQVDGADQTLTTAQQNDDAEAESSAAQTILTLLHQEVGETEALSQPTQDSGLIKQLYSVDDQALSDLQTSVSQSNSQAFQEYLQEANTSEQLLSQIGLTTCAQVAGSSGGG
jgi:hypothetical protein